MKIEPPQSTEKNHSVSMLLRNLLEFSLLIFWAIASIIFLVYEANTLKQHVESFYISITLLAHLFLSAITLSKLEKIFKLIENLESLIEQRKY